MSDESFASEKDEAEFYAALGRAITGWANLEDILFDITFSILQTTKERAAIVFYRTPTFETRLTLTNDLIHSFLPKHKPGDQPDPGVKQWREIQTEIREHTPIRNRLAHHPVGPVIDLYESTDGQKYKVDVVFAINISEGEHLRKGEWLPPLGVGEINSHIKIVSRLANALGNFRRREMPKQPVEPVV